MLFQLPSFLLWSFYMYDTIIWFGFDEQTAITAQYYTYSILLSEMADAINECFIEFLDVMDREKYVTIFSVISACFSCGLIVGMAYLGVTNMVAIGLAQTLLDVTLLFVNVIIIVNKGWLDDCSEGFLKTFGLKVSKP